MYSIKHAEYEDLVACHTIMCLLTIVLVSIQVVDDFLLDRTHSSYLVSLFIVVCCVTAPADVVDNLLCVLSIAIMAYSVFVVVLLSVSVAFLISFGFSQRSGQ